MGGKGGGLLEGKGQGWRGKGKGPIVSGSCGHLSGQEENGESSFSADWPCNATGYVRQLPPWAGPEWCSGAFLTWSCECS